MRKTTVYLTDEEAAGLRRMAASSGTSQAQLIRAGLRHVLAQGGQRTFHSMGLGVGSGEPTTGWDADGVARKTFGRD